MALRHIRNVDELAAVCGGFPPNFDSSDSRSSPTSPTVSPTVSPTAVSNTFTEKQRDALWLHSLLSHGSDTRHWVANARTTLEAVALQDDDLCFPTLIPITLHDQAAADSSSYIVSPMTHYFHYAIEETHKLASRWGRWSSRTALRVLGQYCRRRALDAAAYVNNWLVSTNLYPSLSFEQLRELDEHLVQQYPNHAIVFRSVDRFANENVFDSLRDQGYVPIVSRQVYYATPQAATAAKDSRRDARRLANSPYNVICHDQLTMSDVPRIRSLYNQLYLQKYSQFNPQFTESFLQSALQQRWLEFQALSLDGRIDAVMAGYARGGIMAQPIFGYDLAAPQSSGLYRLLSALVVQRGEVWGLASNNSSGVGRFKRNRGAQRVVEYNLVRFNHLAKRRQRPWKLLRAITRRWVEPMLGQRDF